MGCRLRISCTARQGCPEGFNVCGFAGSGLRFRPARIPVRTYAADTPVLPVVSAVSPSCPYGVVSSSSAAALPTEQVQAVVDISQQLVSSVLSANLNISVEEATKLFRRNAAAALCSEWDIQARIADLQGLLSVNEQECISLICKEPQLLTLGIDDLTKQLENVSVICRCSSEQARTMVLEKSFLLTLTAARLQEKIEFFKNALHLSEPQLHPWVVSHPSVLCHSMHSVTDKLTWLQSFFGADSVVVGQLIIKNPAVLQLSSARLCAEITAMSKTVTVDCLFRMVQQEPRILTVPSARLRQRITDLQQLLHVPHTDAIKLLKQRPSLMSKSLHSLQRALKVLKRLPISDAHLSQLIAIHPLLLRLSPRVLHRRCNSIRFVIHKSTVYRYAFSKLPPNLWGVVIMHWDAACNKICYLTESAQEVKMSLLDAVRATDDRRFLSSFPEYQQWRQWKKEGRQDSREKTEHSSPAEDRAPHKRTHSRRKHSPRRHPPDTAPWTHAAQVQGAEDAQVGDFSHYADLPPTEHIGHYLLHRPHKPKQRPHITTTGRSRGSSRSSISSSSHGPRSSTHAAHSSPKPAAHRRGGGAGGKEGKTDLSLSGGKEGKTDLSLSGGKEGKTDLSLSGGKEDKTDTGRDQVGQLSFVSSGTQTVRGESSSRQQQWSEGRSMEASIPRGATNTEPSQVADADELCPVQERSAKIEEGPILGQQCVSEMQEVHQDAKCDVPNHQESLHGWREREHLEPSAAPRVLDHASMVIPALSRTDCSEMGQGDDPVQDEVRLALEAVDAAAVSLHRHRQRLDHCVAAESSPLGQGVVSSLVEGQLICAT